MSDAPRRRIEATIKIGADSWKDLAAALYDYSIRADRAEQEGEEYINTTSGGYSWGGQMLADEDQDIDHNSYFEANTAWLEEQRAKDPDPETP